MLLLVDLSSEFWRNWFATQSAIKAYELTIDTLMWHRDNYERMAICCEGPSLKRAEMYPEYKAHRDAKPPDAIESIKAVQEQAKRWGVPVLSCPGYEGEDIVATLCRQELFDEVRILGNDKDLYQLITESIKLLTKRGVIGPAECALKFGVRPDQIRDLLALTGDASDNVPGCPGVGIGRARDLLETFGDIDTMMAAKDEELKAVRGVGQKTVDCLRAWDPSLAVSLVSLMSDAPVSLEPTVEEESIPIPF
jgi:DNA polymerase-1